MMWLGLVNHSTFELMLLLDTLLATDGYITRRVTLVLIGFVDNINKDMHPAWSPAYLNYRPSRMLSVVVAWKAITIKKKSDTWK